jgi:hypothetical protein
MSIGHTSAVIGKAVGIHANQICATLASRTTVTAATETAVRVAYDQLWSIPGTSTITRRRALAAGWPSPLAWDDATIDDPATRPATARVNRGAGGVDHAAVERALAGEPTVLRCGADRRETVRRLAAAGVTADVIAAQLGMAVEAVRRTTQRLRAAGPHAGGPSQECAA